MCIFNSSTEEKRRNKEEISDEIRRKIDSVKQSYEEEITRLKRANEREKENFKDKLNKEKNELEKKFQYERENFETKMQVKISDVVRDYKDEMNKLEQKLQKQLSEAENQKFIMTTKLDRQKVNLQPFYIRNPSGRWLLLSGRFLTAVTARVCTIVHQQSFHLICHTSVKLGKCCFD